MRKKTISKKQPALSRIGKEVADSLRDMLAQSAGKKSLIAERFPNNLNVSAIRKRLKLTRREFANTYGLGERTVQEWEQGRRQPDRAAQVLLTVISKNPRAVEDVLRNL